MAQSIITLNNQTVTITQSNPNFTVNEILQDSNLTKQN
ncbi:MAG: hypothetical protein ACD_43C00083G0002 [uncultured bacterium]|nr:MAG: hypothetical protein ACD_43C00083G0002 [uncultured bacterium]